jgi:hypothetical protein
MWRSPLSADCSCLERAGWVCRGSSRLQKAGAGTRTARGQGYDWQLTQLMDGSAAVIPAQGALAWAALAHPGARPNRRCMHVCAAIIEPRRARPCQPLTVPCRVMSPSTLSALDRRFTFCLTLSACGLPRWRETERVRRGPRAGGAERTFVPRQLSKHRLGLGRSPRQSGRGARC